MKLKNVYVAVLGFWAVFFIRCENSPFLEGTNNTTNKVEWFHISLGAKQTTLNWSCSSSTKAWLAYGKHTPDSFKASMTNEKIHSVQMDHLEPNTDYMAYPYCGEMSEEKIFSVPFKTWISDDPIKTRGIWIVGGIGADRKPVAEIDLYDPVENKWYPAVSRMPTPRAYASVVNHKGIIFVIGGIIDVSGAFVISNKVEAYDPISNTWRSYADLPTNIQGAVATSVENNIYVLAGTTTMDMTTGTLTNQVYKLFPDIPEGSAGTWVNYTSSTNIYKKIDMSGCTIGGTLFFTGGRFFNSGNPDPSSDVYVPSANAVTSFNEPSLTGDSRHGAGIACIRPQAGDPYPADRSGVIAAGGSTTGSITQPAGIISPSFQFDYLSTEPTAASFTAGPSIPIARYFPSVEYSYENRKAYVMGGAVSLNVPSTNVYAIEVNLSGAVGGPWETSGLASMPRARYAHSAVIISR